ncbi:regulator of G-protein signaling 3 [Trichonephila clavipes]|nr:regulator of G-protein signaling 3 [Trichonephila clavipes]
MSFPVMLAIANLSPARLSSRTLPLVSNEQPVTKTKSADSAPCSREDGDEKQKKNRKTLANLQDMKMRLSFLRRRHTDSSLQPSSVRPTPEEAHKWAESFQELTNSKYGLSLFRAFLSREFSEENIEFWLACEDYKRTRANKLIPKARKLYDDFVAVQAPKEVNLDSSMRSAIYEHLQNPDRHSFDSAQRRIQGLMEQDAYVRFLQSDLYTDLVQGNSPNTSS